MELGDWGLVVTVVLAHLIALLSPGPDFILVVKSGIRNTTKNARISRARKIFYGNQGQVLQ